MACIRWCLAQLGATGPGVQAAQAHLEAAAALLGRRRAVGQPQGLLSRMQVADPIKS